MTEEEYFRKNYPDSCYGDKPLSPYWDFFQDGVEFGERQSEKKIEELEQENSELKADNDARKFAMAMSEKVEKQLREENEGLKVKVGLSIDCEKAQKDGELCLGYGGDEDEPCERCKNCIKCECGYYQLGETEKDEQLTTAKEIIKTFMGFAEAFGYSPSMDKFITKAEQFLKECE